MNSIKILFIDDEPNTLQVFKAQYRAKFDVFIAESIEKGLHIIDQEFINVVICDYQLQEKNGIQFFAQLRNTHPNLSRILITGHDGIQIAMEAINVGHIYRFVQKPWREDELEIIIKQAYEHYQLIIENQNLLDRLMNNEKLIAALTAMQNK